VTLRAEPTAAERALLDRTLVVVRGLLMVPTSRARLGHRSPGDFPPPSDNVELVSEDEAYTDWFVVLKRSLGIPDIVSGANAEAVIEGWVRERLESSNLNQTDRDRAAKQFMPAIKELSVAGALDCYVLGGLSRYFRPLGDRTAAELVVREAFPEVTVLTTDTAGALLAIAGEITDRMFDYVETHKFPPE
jgi:hypothetical protein